jgi:hypothetical protein
MGKTSFGDIPGQTNSLSVAFASVASNAASATYPLGVAKNAGTIQSCHFVFSTSRASSTKTDGITLVNLGTAGTGTTVLGTLSATAAYASYKPLSLTLAASPTFTAGQAIGVCFASAAATTTVEAAIVQLNLQY